MTLAQQNQLAVRVVLGLCLSGLLLWCFGCTNAQAAPMNAIGDHRGNAGTDVRCSVTGGLHEWMRGGDPADVRCFNCDRPKR